VAALLAATLSACGGGTSSDDTVVLPPDAYEFDLPAGFPEPATPAEGIITPAQVDLGRHLFYDTRLSFNGEGSCASCHEQRKAFTDGRVTSVGPSGDIHPRNAMSLVNAVYNSRQNWANPNIRTLRQQAVLVLFNTDPVELGWTAREAGMLDRLRADSDYPQRFADAFPDVPDPFTVNNVAIALAAFNAALISGRSAYDRFHDPVSPDRGAMSPAARRGEVLFFSERLECNHCHNGFNLANSVVHAGSTFDTTEYKNTGLYNLPQAPPLYPLPAGNYPAVNQGLYEFTEASSDMGRFRPPTLRNIALTAPYMHDGSIATLREVIVDHYARGGRRIDSGPHAGDGAVSPLKDPLMIGFSLSEDELSDLLAFFDSLTDWDFICDERFADPFGRIPMHAHCAPPPPP